MTVHGLLNLEQGADVFWIARNPPMVSTPCTRHFASLREAIGYVMQDIPAETRETAFILLDRGSLRHPAIQAKYAAHADEYSSFE